MYFGHKHLETGPNCLHELAASLKYDMPLNYSKFQLDRVARYTNDGVATYALRSSQSSHLNFFVVAKK